MFYLHSHASHFSSSNRSSFFAHALASAALMVVAGSALAQSTEAEERYGLSGSIGFGVASTPRYEGSPNRRTLAGPDLSLSYNTRDWGRFEAGQNGLIWQAFNRGPFTAGLALGIDPGRKTKDTATADPTPGDKRLAGMGNIRSSAEPGVLLGYGPLSLLARKSLGKRGHEGARVDVKAGWPFSVNDKLGVQVAANLSWADKNYTQAYFGVTSLQSAASGFKSYTPKAGLHKFDVSLGAEYALTEVWKLQTSVTLTQLLGDAADSPLVSKKSAASFAVGVGFAF